MTLLALKMEGLPLLLEAGQGESALSLSLQEESALLTSGFDLCPQVPERKCSKPLGVEICYSTRG